MNRELERNFDNDQQEAFDMNTKRKGESIINLQSMIAGKLITISLPAILGSYDLILILPFFS